MSIFHPTPPEKIIFEFRVNYINDDFVYSRPGVLIVTNLRILYYRKKILKKELKLELDLPLNSLKVKFKKGFVEEPHIVINKTDMVIDLYDNKLVKEWMKKLIKVAKANKGFPIPFPDLPPPFVTKLDHDRVSSSGKSPLVAPQTLPYPKQKPNPAKNDLAGKKRPIRKCSHCGVDILIDARFCPKCGNQI